MSFVTSPKSDRAQILIAVLIMSLLGAFVLGIVAKDNITRFICQYSVFNKICSTLSSSFTSINPDQITSSQITSACVDTQGLKISVIFVPALVGEASIQVFTTGEDVFPSELGMADSFKMSMAVPDSVDQLGFVMPVETMPVGEHVFGNIVVRNGDLVSSHVAFFVRVTDCSATDASNPTLITNTDNMPIAQQTTCLPGKRLMVAFEFDKPVLGQYQALIANLPYQLVSVGNQPAILFFSGDSPSQGPVVIRLISATDQEVVFEESYTPPVCAN
jgi:hypothetical protein